MTPTASALVSAATEPLSPTANFEQKCARLADVLRGLRKVVVGFSGGVDSTVVLKAATLALGFDNAIGVTAWSESMTEEDLELCQDLAADHGFNHRIIEYSELAIGNYADNPSNRCYFCKSELHDRLTALAREWGAVVCDGSIVDDLGDYRPGLQAKRERGVHSPLVEAGMTKDDVRRLARDVYALKNHDKPAQPCLSSRIPYGTKITREKLQQVAKSERFLREELGFRTVRCRHHDVIARIEVPVSDFAAALEKRELIVARLKEFGFRYITIDLQGFRSGSLNEAIGKR